MTRSFLPRTLILSTIASLAIATGASAQATRTWVSGVGDDVNPCSRTAPCKTFAGAISKTAENGEISVLDPGGYGAVTITKSITINGEGTLAGILSAGTNGVIVNVTTNPSTAVVILRNISINGAKTGLDGIRYLAGNALVVDHCWIYGVTGDGIEVVGTGLRNLKVNDTIIERAGGSAIKMDTTTGQVVAMISRSHLQDSLVGIDALNRVRATVSNTVITHVTDGMRTTGTDSVINADDVLVAFAGGTGVKSNNAGIQSHIRLSDCTITQNATGLFPNGGTIDSFQGNSVFGNGADGLPFSSTTLKQ